MLKMWRRQCGTRNVTLVNGSQQGQIDHVWVGVGLASLIKGKRNIAFYSSWYFPKVYTCRRNKSRLGCVPAALAPYPRRVSVSHIKADKWLACDSPIIIILTNFLLVYASDEWVSFNYLLKYSLLACFNFAKSQSERNKSKENLNDHCSFMSTVQRRNACYKDDQPITEYASVKGNYTWSVHILQ